MKYIRTKNGIYDVANMSVASIYDNGVFIKNVSYTKKIDDFTFLHIDEKDILKQADTIEELCDEVVIVYPDGSHSNSWCYNYDSFYDSLYGQIGSFNLPIKENLNEYNIYEIYGAIWTEKGLIYVAKMNEKGELELL